MIRLAVRRKTVRAYALPPVFRPLRMRGPCFIGHRRRKADDQINFRSTEGGICQHFFSLAGDAKRNRGIHQCAHWFMHMPPACADMIRILPLCKKEDHPTGGLLFWQRRKDSNPHKRSQSPVCYLYTTPLNARDIIHDFRDLSSSNLQFLCCRRYYSSSRTRSVPLSASSTSALTSSAFSTASTSDTRGLVRGWRGVKTVQQSS